ncbi:hypothetical protein HBH47_072960 [Parastagonospora nodorum]|nr:hypothetical protein HBH47_072960 [Parastagonospora nodorum]
MTLLRQTRERSSRDSICDAMTLISDEYETLYAEVEREMRERAILSCCKRRKMQYNHNPKTGLRNNDRYAEAVVYSAGQSNTVNNAPQLSTILFIRTLEREVGFEDKRSGIYYYTKTADSWTYTVATKLYRATFVIELLI